MTLKRADKQIKLEKCGSGVTRHFCTVDVNIWYFEGRGGVRKACYSISTS